MVLIVCMSQIDIQLMQLAALRNGHLKKKKDNMDFFLSASWLTCFSNVSPHNGDSVGLEAVGCSLYAWNKLYTQAKLCIPRGRYMGTVFNLFKISSIVAKKCHFCRK